MALGIAPLAIGSYPITAQALFQPGSRTHWWHHSPHPRGLGEVAEVCGVLGSAESCKS